MCAVPLACQCLLQATAYASTQMSTSMQTPACTCMLHMHMSPGKLSRAHWHSSSASLSHFLPGTPLEWGTWSYNCDTAALQLPLQHHMTPTRHVQHTDRDDPPTDWVALGGWSIPSCAAAMQHGLWNAQQQLTMLSALDWSNPDCQGPVLPAACSSNWYHLLPRPHARWQLVASRHYL